MVKVVMTNGRRMKLVQIRFTLTSRAAYRKRPQHAEITSTITFSKITVQVIWYPTCY